VEDFGFLFHISSYSLSNYPEQNDKKKKIPPKFKLRPSKSMAITIQVFRLVVRQEMAQVSKISVICKNDDGPFSIRPELL